MSMQIVERWVRDGDGLVRRGRPRRADQTAFILGVTEPTRENTGVTGAARENYNGSITGTSDPLNPKLVKRADIGSLVTLGAGYFRFEDCKFTGGPGTFNTAQVDCRAASVQGVCFDRCDFDPVNRSFYLNNLIGHHMDVWRCFFQGGVDAIGSYNQFGRRTDNKIQGSFGSWQVRYDVDIDHSDGTHNDFVQHQGGEGLWVIGNSAWGYTRYDSGATPAAPYNRTSQFVIVQQNVKFPNTDQGVYYLDDVHINRNWVRGFMQGIVGKTRSANGRAYDIEARDNIWANADQRDFGGSFKFYNGRLDGATTLNGVEYPTSGATADAFGNRYADTDEVGATYRGKPIMIRRDAGLGV